MTFVSSAGLEPALHEVREDGTTYRRWHFFGSSVEITDGPQAILVDYATLPADGTVVAKPHFHQVRQFQLVVAGDEPRIGKDELPAHAFHYTDPSTPYGPIVADRAGVTWFTLRARSDVGVYWMPGSRDRMTQRAGRNVVARIPQRELPARGAASETLISPHDDGLAAVLVRLGPGEELAGPSPEGSGGQFHVVLQGTLRDGGEELPRLSLGWSGPDGPALRMSAGDGGAEVVVLQFPVAPEGWEAVDPAAGGDVKAATIRAGA